MYWNKNGEIDRLYNIAVTDTKSSAELRGWLGSYITKGITEVV